MITNMSLDYPNLKLEDVEDNSDSDNDNNKPSTTKYHGDSDTETNNKDTDKNFGITIIQPFDKKDDQEYKLQQLMQSFDELLKNYNLATAQLEQLSKQGNNKANEEHTKLTNDNLKQINQKFDSLANVINQISQNQQLLAKQLQANNQKLSEIENANANNNNNNNANKNQENEYNNNKQLLNELKKSIQQLSIKIENISTLNSGNQSHYGDNDGTTNEQSPLIEKDNIKTNNVMMLEPPDYFLKREWCLGCVCCYTHACGCGCL